MNNAVFTDYLKAEETVLEWIHYAQSLGSTLLQAHFPIDTGILDRTTGKKYKIVGHEFSKTHNQMVVLARQVDGKRGMPKKLTLKEILSTWQF